MSSLSVALAPHPLLCLRALAVEFAAALDSLVVPADLAAALLPGAALSLLKPDDALRGHIRDLLRHAGFKPTGRSKPSSEYLLRIAEEGKWPAINAVVDIGNAVSLHSGIPISVVDVARARPPLRVAISPSPAQFVFNTAGQVIDVGGLLGLSDADGPCANAVKDAQRTKTSADTTRALILLWGHVAVEPQVEAAARQAKELLQRAGGRVQSVACEREAAS